jgi:hypothetical protein
MSQGEAEHPAGVPLPPLRHTLFALLGGAFAWTLHFMGSYALLAVGCVAGWPGVRTSLVVGTVLLLALAAWSTLVAWRAWRDVSGDQPWDVALGEPKGWYAFLMLTGVLMGAVAALTILLEGAGSIFLPVCGWDVR